MENVKMCQTRGDLSHVGTIFLLKFFEIPGRIKLRGNQWDVGINKNERRENYKPSNWL